MNGWDYGMGKERAWYGISCRHGDVSCADASSIKLEKVNVCEDGVECDWRGLHI